MKKTFKREFVIAQLAQFGIREIESRPVEKLEYSVLLKELTLKRADNN